MFGANCGSALPGKVEIGEFQIIVSRYKPEYSRLHMTKIVVLRWIETYVAKRFSVVLVCCYQAEAIDLG